MFCHVDLLAAIAPDGFNLTVDPCFKPDEGPLQTLEAARFAAAGAASRVELLEDWLPLSRLPVGCSWRAWRSLSRHFLRPCPFRWSIANPFKGTYLVIRRCRTSLQHLMFINSLSLFVANNRFFIVQTNVIFVIVSVESIETASSGAMCSGQQC